MGYKSTIIFKKHLDEIYKTFSRKIVYPELRIRKMTTRWGVCNTKTKVITLNLELIKRDEKYLDYVIVHELSHLIYPNHSSKFWELVEENFPKYKQIKKEMKEFIHSILSSIVSGNNSTFWYFDTVSINCTIIHFCNA